MANKGRHYHAGTQDETPSKGAAARERVQGALQSVRARLNAAGHVKADGATLAAVDVAAAAILAASIGDSAPDSNFPLDWADLQSQVQDVDLAAIGLETLMAVETVLASVATPERPIDPMEEAFERLTELDVDPGSDDSPIVMPDLTALDLQYLMTVQTLPAETGDYAPIPSHEDVAAIELQMALSLEVGDDANAPAAPPSGAGSGSLEVSDTGESLDTAFIDGGSQESIVQIADTSDTVFLEFDSSAGAGSGSTSGGVPAPSPPANFAPVAATDAVATTEDEAVKLDVLANDRDPDGDALTVTGAKLSGGLGSITVASDSIVYDPAGAYNHLCVGENATVTVDYTVSDGNGGAAAATATVTVVGTNDTPVAVDDGGSTPADTALKLDVLANDSDPDTGDTLAVASVSQGANGQVVIDADGSVTYTPNAGFSGDDSFTYTLVDGNGGTDTATVTVKVGTSGVYLTGTSNPDTLIGTAGDDTLTGEAGDDLLYGLGGNDTLDGDSKNDQLYGDDGADSLNGGSGDDVLYGGTGWDTLTGGSGKDDFVIEPDGAGQTDLITDFSVGEDSIDLTAYALTDMGDLVIGNDGGGNAVIALPGGDTIILAGVDETTLTAGDFAF